MKSHEQEDSVPDLFKNNAYQKNNNNTSPGLPWQSSSEDAARAWVQALVRELRSHILYGTAKKQTTIKPNLLQVLGVLENTLLNTYHLLGERQLISTLTQWWWVTPHSPWLQCFSQCDGDDTIKDSWDG